MIRIGLIGAEGEMGRRIVMELAESKRFQLTAAVTEKESKHLGEDIGEILSLPETGAKLVTDIEPYILDVDVILDYSTPESTLHHLQIIQNHGVPTLVGTRGFTDEELMTARSASHMMPLFLTDNSSMGINLVFNFLTHASRFYNRDTDIYICEEGATADPEAPSTITVNMMKLLAKKYDIYLSSDELIAKIVNNDINQRLIFSVKNNPDEHDTYHVEFVSDEEDISITHQVKDDIVFVRGALYCAEWLIDRRPGLYGVKNLFDYTEE